MWTGLTWVIMPILSIKFGYMGVAYSTALIATSSIVTIYMAKKHVEFSLINIIKTPILSLVPMTLWLFLSVSSITSYLSLLTVIMSSALIYFISILILEGKVFFTETLSYFKIKHA